ncbi:MAG: hypothetical protein LAP86_04340 [Acidobacteriia bacterium]|nr:hypothetical protein [Terriglobia bacterium]
MGRFRSLSLRLAVAFLSFLTITGCGGGSHPGPPLFPGRINLNPGSATSLVLGGTLTFTASVQTASGTNLAVPVTYSSSDPSILNLAPNGVACAGHWDVAFTTCTPGAMGPVTVTASALGGTSVPTYVFVHPPIDNITVVGVIPDGAQVQEPCLSQSQSMTVEAHAYSQGTDITASVGPFTWSANNASVVSLTPLTNNAFNFATNQATAKANTPGITYIYASANGVSSSSFQQPQLTNAQGAGSPVLDFFATCPVQNIALELGAAGSGRTTFNVPKGSASQTVIATVTDIMGVSSLPNTDGGIVLSKIPLTWTSSQPGSIGTPTSGCTQSCALSLSTPGSATVTASCSPPTCNVGFPTIPNAFLTNGVIDSNKITACTNFFKALYPQLADCGELIPVPVYASPVFVNPGNPTLPLSPMAAISGIVTGSTSSPTVFASSTGCAQEPPSTCNTSAYFVSTRTSAGNENPLPVSPNSFLFDPTGGKVWMGSDFGAQIVTPSNLGTANSPFTPLGTVTGNVLASSLNGAIAAFSDTVHTPNQVYIVNSSNTGSPTALSIPGPLAPQKEIAGFSPDGLKTFIIAGPNLTSMYVYSSLQALQGPIALAQPGTAIAFSPNGAFTFVAESGLNSFNLTAFANCINPAVAPIQPAASIALPGAPLLMKVLPALHIDGKDSFGNTIPDGVHVLILDSNGFDIVTSKISPPATGKLCPQGIQFVSGDPLRAVQRIELGQGTLQPVNFFYSADDTQLYVVSSSSSSIIVYSFITGSVIGGIELQNNATPITADMSVDAGTIVIAGSDGMLHEVSTALGGSDSVPISFPNIPNGLNPFCSFTPLAGPCTLNVVQSRP